MGCPTTCPLDYLSSVDNVNMDPKIITPELWALARENKELMRALSADAAGEYLKDLDLSELLTELITERPTTWELHYRLMSYAITRARVEPLKAALDRFLSSFAKLSEEQRWPYYSIIHLNLLPEIYFLGDGELARRSISDIPESYYTENSLARRKRQYVECIDLVAKGLSVKPMAYCHAKWHLDKPILLPETLNGEPMTEAYSMRLAGVDNRSFLRSFTFVDANSAEQRSDPELPTLDNIMISFEVAKYTNEPQPLSLSLSLAELTEFCDNLPKSLEWDPEQTEAGKEVENKFAEMGFYGPDQTILVRFFEANEGVLDIGKPHLDQMRYLKTSGMISHE